MKIKMFEANRRNSQAKNLLQVVGVLGLSLCASLATAAADPRVAHNAASRLALYRDGKPFIDRNVEPSSSKSRRNQIPGARIR